MEILVAHEIDAGTAEGRNGKEVLVPAIDLIANLARIPAKGEGQMAIDWFATVSAAGELAKTAAQDVPIALVNERMTLDEASRLYRAVEMRAQDCDAMIAEMQDDDDVNEALLDAADHLSTMWDRLSLACANKVRELQGLPPIPFVEDDEEDEEY